MTIILTENGKRIDEFELPGDDVPKDYIQVHVFCDLHVCYHTGHFFYKGIHDDGVIFERVLVGA